MFRHEQRGLILILSSPSGAGKTTLSRALLKRENNLALSVSCTTRKPRKGEIEGQDYHFVSLEDFGIMRNKGAFLESAKVFGHYYGTPAQPIKEALYMGKDIIFDIDWQGTQQLQEQMADDVVTIFVLPPSRADLQTRLLRRAQDSQKTVKQRMSKASDEISHYAEYQYIVINEDATRAVSEVQAILHAERLRRHRQTNLSDFVKTLRASLS